MANGTVAANEPVIVLPKGGERGWSLRNENHPDWVLAIVHCPKCRVPVSLSKQIHYIRGKDGAVIPALACPHKGCGFQRFIQLHNWTPLWAIAFERFVGIRDRKPLWKPLIHYCHAHNAEEARAEFYNCEGHLANNTRIVDIAPVVGYNATTDDEKVLIV